MTDEERKALLEKMRVAAEEAKKMTPEQARSALIKGGFLTEDGQLSPEYGGGVDDHQG